MISLSSPHNKGIDSLPLKTLTVDSAEQTDPFFCPFWSENNQSLSIAIKGNLYSEIVS